MRVRTPVHAAAAAACTLIALVAPAAARAAAPASHRATVLVFMRHGAGGSRAHAAQASVATLAAELGGRVLARTTVPDTLTVRVTATGAHALATSPLVAAVLPDVAIPGPATPSSPRPTSAPRGTRPARASCGTAAHPQLNPEALSAIHDTPGTTLGYSGKGVTVAFLADGIQTSNVEFRRNPQFASAGSPAGSPVITTYRDFSGDGTTAKTPGGEAFLDAGSIGAQGNGVYDLSAAVAAAHPLPRGCDIRIVGAAPGASIMALKIFARGNTTTASGYVQAISYAVSHGASVINESFGGNGFPDSAADIVRQADEAAIAAGVTVVASTGDAGITSTISSPASDPSVIAAGASTTFRAYQQDTFGGINLPGERGTYLNNNISSFSSAGFAQDDTTVGLVAPGDLNWVPCTRSPAFTDCAGQPIQLTGGTSESSPLIAGAAADVIQAYRAAHHATSPSPALVRAILTSTATDIGAPAEQQGAGLLNVLAAVRLALSAPGTTQSPPPGGVLASSPQLDLAGQPGSGVGGTFTLTNTSSAPVAVSLSTRAFQAFRTTNGAVTLNPAASSRQPRFPVWSGAPEVYQTITLPVGRQVARIQLQAAYTFRGQSSAAHVALFSPSGQLAGFSNPQGIGDYADVEVAHPAPGAWRAAVFTLWDGAHRGQGTSGRVPWRFTEERAVPLGAVSPSQVTIGAGASQGFSYHDTLPSIAGDAAASIVVRSPSGTSSIPVTLRTMVGIGASGGRFAGVLTGGNGRGGAPGQTNTWTFNVPTGKRDLDVGVAMASNPPAGEVPAIQVIGMLVDPEGVVTAYDSNFTQNAHGEVATRFLDLYADAPQAGTWSLVLDWVQPTTGTATTVPFTGSVGFNLVSVSATLPDSAATTVSKAGMSFSLHVTNTGVAPMVLSPDARLATPVLLSLHDVADTAATQPLPGAMNVYYVPTQTSALHVDVKAAAPTTFDFSYAPGDPDLAPTIPSPFTTESWTPTDSSVTYAPPGGLSAGEWNVFQAEIGPYGATGEPRVVETTAVQATTLAFDPSVTSSVPDTVEALTTGGSLLPALVPAGHAVTITVTIAPRASVGTVVSGTLYLDGLQPGSLLQGTIALTSLYTSELAAIPYRYTVAP